MMTMKAMVYNRYGAADVLHLDEVQKPIPKRNELLIRVKASAVNSADWRLRKAEPFAVRLFFGLTKPRNKILGGVFSGVVEETGTDVQKFKPGDDVFGTTGLKMGAYGEYVCLSDKSCVIPKPAMISHEEAAVIPFGATTAYHFLQKAKLKKGEKILINGASGAVGSAAVQLAKYMGAEVSGICSTSNLDMVRSIGADVVIDYTREDYRSKNIKYDVIMDTVDKLDYNDCLQLLKPNGRLVLSDAGAANTIKGIWHNLISSKKVITGVALEKASELEYIKELIEKGQYKAVIDRSYPLEDLVAAHTYVEQGHKKGNVSIIV